jgi:tRNA pseudouridine38-40 synthase
VAHCDVSKDWEPPKLLSAVNHFLRPERVAVLTVERVADDFSARFDALARHYRYRIVVRKAPLAIDHGRAGAAHLVGHHDFTTFRSVHCQSASPVKTLDRLDIAQEGNAFVFDVRARSFLHNQVRSFVGTLQHVGAGAWPPERVGEALAARDRAACGPVAPPEGLYLDRVIYTHGE